ncbi:MAG: hypothetical protein KDD94_14045 [Calditrichaeota bacterium]|nr:hypothetical protein [Calditrichota bacterium]
MATEEIISAIGLVGLGGLLKSTLDFFIANKKQKSESKQQLKETRYKAIILMCYAYINFEKEKTTLIINRPDITSKERLFNELNVEWINMSLFASDRVLLKMKDFLELLNPAKYNELVLEMRKDLYGVKTKIKLDNLVLKERNL